MAANMKVGEYNYWSFTTMEEIIFIASMIALRSKITGDSELMKLVQRFYFEEGEMISNSLLRKLNALLKDNSLEALEFPISQPDTYTFTKGLRKAESRAEMRDKLTLMSADERSKLVARARAELLSLPHRDRSTLERLDGVGGQLNPRRNKPESFSRNLTVTDRRQLEGDIADLRSEVTLLKKIVLDIARKN